MPEIDKPNVLRISDAGLASLQDLFKPFGLVVSLVRATDAIPGSHWGDDEAGLIKNTLFVRSDTPLHSALHEASHWLMMNVERRAALHTNAGGTALEENAVCYLQILLAEKLEAFGRERCFDDMDAWGYSFRLGSTREWFYHDAEDARELLTNHIRQQETGLMDLLPLKESARKTAPS